ncbi:MAG: protein translocase subunit SecF [Luteitalea sp.]|nr:protein translocase subunit SecF [Luteitalea sp.]
MRILANTNYDFIRWRWHALALSALILLTGVGLMVKQGGPALGIDFSGGTSIVLKFDQATPEETVRRALESISGDKIVQQYGQPGDNEIMVRLPVMEGTEQGTSLDQSSKQVVQTLQEAKIGTFEVAGSELVGPIIGRDLQRRGIWAVVLSILGIGVYIALRFRPSFAVGAMVATVHDILVVLAFLTFVQQFRIGYELSLNVVAAILTIAGYSVNDTIVIFDRVRENLRVLRRESLTTIVNRSVNQTLSRTVITTGTTLLAMMALFLFGGEVLKGFAYSMLVGIIVGTYSTVFIASSIAIVVSKRGREARAGATAPPAATATAAAPAAPSVSARPKVRRRRRG